MRRIMAAVAISCITVMALCSCRAHKSTQTDPRKDSIVMVGDSIDGFVPATVSPAILTEP